MTTQEYAPPRRLEGVFTARYQDAEKARVQPVRTSLGYPKWMGPGLPGVMLLAPKGLFHIEDDAVFERLYREKLDRAGVDRIRRDIEQLRDQFAPTPIALCCYEADPAECHRSMFARWWQEQTGELIPELRSLPVDELRVLWPDLAAKLAITEPVEPVQGSLL